MDIHDPEQVNAWLADIQAEEGENFIVSKPGIAHELESHAALPSPLAVKILTILGGILATGFFLGFLAETGLYDSDTGMVIWGTLFIIGSVLMVRIKDRTIIETTCISFHIAGYLLLCIGLAEMVSNPSVICLLLMSIALTMLAVTGNAILNFVSVLAFHASGLALIIVNEAYPYIHAYVAFLSFLLTYLSLREAHIISVHPRFTISYGPVRTGVVYSLVGALILLVHQSMFETRIEHLWLSSLAPTLCICLLTYRVMKISSLLTFRQQGPFFLISILILGSTLLTPSIQGALLILLLGFYTGHTFSFITGMVALIYFVILFYYDLQMTLLVKSGMLLLSGFLCISGYFVFNKQLKKHAP